MFLAPAVGDQDVSLRQAIKAVTINPSRDLLLKRLLPILFVTLTAIPDVREAQPPGRMMATTDLTKERTRPILRSA